MDIAVRHPAPGEAQLALRGDLDFETAEKLRVVVGGLLQAGHRRLTIGLAGVQLCDSSGLSALLDAQHAADARGAGFRLTGIGPSLARVLQVTGLDEVFGLAHRVEPDLATPGDGPGALSAVPGGPAGPGG